MPREESPAEKKMKEYFKQNDRELAEKSKIKDPDARPDPAPRMTPTAK